MDKIRFWDCSGVIGRRIVKNPGSLNFAYLAAKHHKEAEERKGHLAGIPLDCNDPASAVPILPDKGTGK